MPWFAICVREMIIVCLKHAVQNCATWTMHLHCRLSLYLYALHSGAEAKCLHWCCPPNPCDPESRKHGSPISLSILALCLPMGMFRSSPRDSNALRGFANPGQPCGKGWMSLGRTHHPFSQTWASPWADVGPADVCGPLFSLEFGSQ